MAANNYNEDFGQKTFHAQGYVPATVAQPYNGPVAQELAYPTRAPTAPQVVVIREHEEIPMRPSNHCLMSWFSCFFCCWIVGLFAVCNSYQVDILFERRDYDGALRASERAKVYSTLAIVLGLVVYVLGLIAGTSEEDSDGPSRGG